MECSVFTYWHDETEMPAYIGLCIDTMARHLGDDLVFLTEAGVPGYLPDLRDLTVIENVATRTDYVKASLLRAYGGIWIDADSIVLSPFEKIKGLLGHNDFVGKINTQGWYGVNFMASRANGAVMKDYLAAIDQILDAGEELRSGNSLGARALTPVLEVTTAPVHTLTYEVSPINFQECERFFEKDGLEISEETICVMLYNRLFPDWFKQMPAQDILKEDYNISKLLRKGLGVEAI